MKKTVKLIITGSLQSMFFRQFIKENAEINDVSGFIRKLENNDIEVILEGDRPDVDEMINICKTGPKHAIIRNVQIQEMLFQDLKGFKIINF